MIRPDPAPGGEALLHCNSDRTLFLRRDAASGTLLVHKVLLRGSLAEAEHECAIGRRLAHLDVAEYLDATTDSATGRPCIRIRFHAGQSLDELVAARGGLPAAEACAILAPVAATLAAMHGMRAPDLPQGLCHGDVKPANLLHHAGRTLLLDFEHAGATRQRTSAGTPGFAAPEAAAAAPLQPSFDVHGLGATLCWLLTGRPPDHTRLRGHDAELQLLANACLQPDPRARPPAAVVAEGLTALAARLRDDPLEHVRTALFAGDLAAAAARLTEHPDAELRTLLRQRQRLLDRRPALIAHASTLPSGSPTPATLADRLTALRAFVRRFPRHPAALHHRQLGKQRAGELLAAQLPTVFDLVRAERFDAARTRLDELRRLTAVALALPGPLRVPGDGDGRMPTLLQRAPLACLDQERRRLDAAVAEHDDLLATLHEAEGALALDDAAGAIESISSRYGGTSEAVARYRDRLHRLGFYVERIARARPNIDRLFELVPDENPAPLLHFVAECAAAVAPAAAAAAENRSPGAIGVRNLHLALGNLRDEFATVRDRSAPALHCLERALRRVTDEAWMLLADAQQKLLSETIPVRPLQLVLGRLDTFRTLEAFVDRPQQPRSTLVDRIEALRLRLEQAQATRDRLARGAEQALAKGHWTTGLFDMERAVTHLQSDDADDRQTMQLRQKLAEAKKRKLEIESAQRRNHELASRYAALQDDLGSTTTERLAVLREQRDCLQFLAVHAQRERSDLYARDLRDIDLRMVQEQASQAEAELDGAESPAERLRIAAQTLAQLEAFAARNEKDGELPGRIARLVDHWRRRHGSEQRELDRRTAEASARRRRRTFAAAVAAVLVIGSGFALRHWPGTPAAAAERSPLHVAATALPDALRPLALQATALVETDPVRESTALLAAAESSLDALLAASRDAERAAAGAFAQRLWQAAIARAGADADAPTVAAATARLVARGMATTTAR